MDKQTDLLLTLGAHDERLAALESRLDAALARIAQLEQETRLHHPVPPYLPVNPGYPLPPSFTCGAQFRTPS